MEEIMNCHLVNSCHEKARRHALLERGGGRRHVTQWLIRFTKGREGGEEVGPRSKIPGRWDGRSMARCSRLRIKIVGTAAVRGLGGIC